MFYNYFLTIDITHSMPTFTPSSSLTEQACISHFLSRNEFNESPIAILIIIKI
jgi:hypothetical protein